MKTIRNAHRRAKTKQSLREWGKGTECQEYVDNLLKLKNEGKPAEWTDKAMMIALTD